MIVKLYLEDATVLAADVMITQIETTPDGSSIVRTNLGIFHPAGGGQKADQGRIGEAKVIDVRRSDNGEIDHVVDHVPTDWTIGITLRAVVDPEWRKNNSALHTAGHALAHCIEKCSSGLKAVQGHHWPGEAAVVFDGAIPADLDDLKSRTQAMLDDVVAAELPVCVVGDPHSDRRVAIGEFEKLSCGGTHLCNLAQLQRIEIRSMRVKKGKLRIGYDVFIND